MVDNRQVQPHLNGTGGRAELQAALEADDMTGKIAFGGLEVVGVDERKNLTALVPCLCTAAVLLCCCCAVLCCAVPHAHFAEQSPP